MNHRPTTIACPFCARLNRVDLTKLDRGPKCAECGRPLHFDRPIKATGADFDRTIQDTAVPIVVDFYADWCGPCKVLAPTIDQLAHDRSGEIVVLKVDTDRDQELSMRFGIRGIPTVIGFFGGREVGRVVGIATRPELDQLVTRK